MSRPMPALSFWQPWGTLVAAGLKDIETRSWAPHRDIVGGRLAIAATASIPAEAKEALRHGAAGSQALIDAVRQAGHTIAWDRRKLVTSLPLGQMLCTVHVDAAYPMIGPDGVVPPGGEYLLVERTRLTLVTADGDVDITDQFLFGDFRPGRFGWRFTDPQPIEGHHPVRGRQGIWNWEPSTST